MAEQLRSPYIFMRTDFGFKSSLDPGSVNGATVSEEFARLFEYPILYRGVVYNLSEFEAVTNAVNYANESLRSGRFNPRVLEEILPNLSAKPCVVK